MPFTTRLLPARSPKLRLGALGALGVAWGVAWGVATPAQAVVEVAVQLDSSWASDSNPLRLADSNPAANPVQGRQSDSLMSVDARAALITPLLSDSTRLEITASQGRRQYRQQSQLNHQAQQFEARLLWEATPLLRGRVSYATDERLYQPQNSVQVVRDLVRQQTTGSEVALRATPELEVPLTLERVSVRHDAAQNQYLDRNDNAVQLALRHQSPLGSTLTVGQRRLSVDYPNRSPADVAVLDDRYRDQLSFVEVDWVYSPLTRLGGRLGHLQRSYQNLGPNNFSLMVGNLSAGYQFSPMSRVDVEWFRQVYDSATPSTLYYLASGVRLGLGWRWTELTRLRLLANHERQQNQPGQLGGLPSQPDNLRTRLGASLDYSLARGWRAYVEGSRDRFVSVNGGAAIAQNVVRLGLEYTYESLAGTAERGRLGRRP
ncbi:hypothetical protein PSQ40_01175 [Curvibacter sp. HBC61]|uniref:DUF3570 domain-containing protein n=1 Tax=Curvibacter cyanobacteriorum TaxID=3026422 RepID=A0ABT5MV45_9BURK|nr:hypothetical protein [Curvibacter sp. HBC61]MDD0837171.1 hypothetical protein [Curvibacter sp. HBC61]